MSSALNPPGLSSATIVACLVTSGVCPSRIRIHSYEFLTVEPESSFVVVHSGPGGFCLRIHSKFLSGLLLNPIDGVRLAPNTIGCPDKNAAISLRIDNDSALKRVLALLSRPMDGGHPKEPVDNLMSAAKLEDGAADQSQTTCQSAEKVLKLNALELKTKV